MIIFVLLFSKLRQITYDFLFVFVVALSFCLCGCSNCSHDMARITDIPVVNDDLRLFNFYIVQSGDSLFKIAKHHNIDIGTIKEINRINNDVIKIGDMLYIPTSIYNSQRKKSYVNIDKSVNFTRNTNKLSIEERKTTINNDSWGWPCNGDIITKFDSYNRGIDISGNIGDSVVAASDGKVVYSGNGVRGFGNLLIISHDDGFITAYAHNSKLLVVAGDMVSKNMNIAEMGKSDSDYCKLHFEIRKNGVPIDPLKVLPVR
ncbi:peptidoglycan DD-metalloendopeptidase family protein [Candidatus Kinetoplastidibacterium crithidiae]|uniref:Lipoprotein NlpD n=1 Tax=Candidatus Kinetoplastidibacterium crithidiae TCC036E TaxID=1208918 RepID=M1LTX1_9PROT|nr:peptidoglycan DD-metalloendopeptidase family protein [Candidatus Kinetoplastibacterium crithidii]AFZ82791.1 lipoprotein NlpD [Candidatus Kinetoplastibacterium crithidii (ex Angomonas deanei ATCC 30255)]AGF47556.1 lipoprotein NlpD [Candidatus Kinetoplastibacterium crithidii TCC036E]